MTAATSKATLFTATDASSYATGSWTPTANRLYLVSVGASHGSASPVPTLSGNGITWVQIATDNSSSFERLTVFQGSSGSGSSAGALTADFGGVTQLGCEIAIEECDGDYVVNNSIVQGSNSSNNLNIGGIALSRALADATNAVYCAVRIDVTAAITGGSGFTTLADGTHANNNTRLFTQYKVNQNSASASWGSTSRECVVLVEFGPVPYVPSVLIGRESPRGAHRGVTQGAI